MYRYQLPRGCANIVYHKHALIKIKVKKKSTGKNRKKKVKISDLNILPDELYLKEKSESL